MPPWSVRTEGGDEVWQDSESKSEARCADGENKRQGRATWRRSVVEPAVPGSAVSILGSSMGRPGRKSTVVDPTSTPLVSAEQIAATRFMPTDLLGC